MKPSLMKRFSDFLFEVDDAKTLTARVPVAAVPEPPTTPVIPPINMKPYLAARIEDIAPKGSQGRGWQEKDIMKFSEETLEMILGFPRLKELDNQFLDRNEDEGCLRSLLVLMSSERLAATIVTGIEYAYQTVCKYHVLGFTDLSQQDEVTIDRVGAAVELMASSGDTLLIPPHLTYYAMRNPDKVNDIVSYVKEHHSDSSTFHLIDMDRLNEYVNSDNKALRDGML